ncbi:hypothetical protein F5887DRAFT_551339 [Amanita rubescens]|nr:hypothetical protein F5887DRAFT_551339 [Amanita rubescens]
MKLSLLASVFLSTLLATVMSAPTQATIGSVLVMSNVPYGEGNQLLVSDIYADGTIAFRNATRAGGFGAHGYTGGPLVKVNDGLFSQGAIVVSQKANMAIAVNAGANTVSIFTINPDDPGDVNLLAKPVGSGGEFPTSAVFNKAGTKACVLNGGEINGVACFHVDQIKGLVPISHSVRYLNMPQTTPAFGVPGSVSQVVFSPDEKQVVVLAKGDNVTEGFIAAWNINTDDSLAQTPTIMNIGKNVFPFSMTPIPGSNAYVSGDAALGYDIFNLDSFRRKDVKLMTEYPVPGQKGICWSVQSPLTGNYYMTDTFGGKVVEVSISSDLEAKTVKQYYTDAYDVLLDIDVIHTPSTDYLYSLAANFTSINVMKIEGPGEANLIQKLDLTPGAYNLGLPVDHLYIQGLAVYTKTH